MKVLKAGNLDVLLDQTQLRYIQYNGAEIVRGIYAAVRDENWDTVIPKVSIVSLTESANTFKVLLNAVYQQADIHFEANFIYEGKPNSEIECIFEGKAYTSFKKNRIGFCVLHPLKECLGKEVIINGKEKKTFPEFISPHQPLLDIQSMTWFPVENSQAELYFEGDIFETEDQRNWTDASFKTYCTPLRQPFPVWVKKGEEIKQKVILKFQTLDNFVKERTSLRIPKFPTKFEEIHTSLGLGISTVKTDLNEQEIAWLRSTKVDHLRADIELFNTNWQRELSRAAAQAKALHWKLEAVLHFSENYEQEASDFLAYDLSKSVSYHSILLLKYRQAGLETNVQRFLINAFRKVLPHVKLGIGTDAYFAELNRANLDVSDVDFIGFSINPQVHAFDDLSLIETLEAQKDTVLTAKQKWKNIPVHIHSITLRPRFNPNATRPDEAGYPQSDERQNTDFCYQWTKASMNTLQKAGVASITYFETVGQRGIMHEGKFPVLEAFC